MKNIILLVALISSGIANAEIVNIPDAQFKVALLRANSDNSWSSNIAKDIDGNWVTIDVNNDNEIQVSEAEIIYSLYLAGDSIQVLTGIEDFINLEFLDCKYNPLTTLDLSNNIKLEFLDCRYNPLTNLDLSNNVNLIWVECSVNNIANLDLSSNINLENLRCAYMPNLEYLNLKNVNKSTGFLLSGNPNLNTICIDDIDDLDYINNITSRIGHPVSFTEDCSVIPTSRNQINGSIKLDINNDGCDGSDIPMPNLMLQSSNGTESFATFTQSNGDYLLYTNEGNFTTAVIGNLPKYYIIPSTQTNTFTGFNNTFTADFC